MQYTFKNLQQSFKSSYENLIKNKWISYLVITILLIIVIISFKNYSIDLFTDPPTTTKPPTTTIPITTFIDIKKNDIIQPPTPTTTNAFTNFNFNFIKNYLDYKSLKNQNLDRLNEKQKQLDNLNTRIGNIINQ